MSIGIDIGIGNYVGIGFGIDIDFGIGNGINNGIGVGTVTGIGIRGNTFSFQFLCLDIRIGYCNTIFWYC